MTNENIGRRLAVGVISFSVIAMALNMPINYKTDVVNPKSKEYTVSEVFIETNKSNTENIKAQWDSNYDYGQRSVDKVYAIDTKGEKHDLSYLYKSNLEGINEDLISSGMVLKDSSEKEIKKASVYIPGLNKKEKTGDYTKDIDKLIVDKSKMDKEKPMGIRLTVKNEGAGHTTFKAHYKQGKVIILEGDERP